MLALQFEKNGFAIFFITYNNISCNINNIKRQVKCNIKINPLFYKKKKKLKEQKKLQVSKTMRFFDNKLGRYYKFKLHDVTLG